MSIKLLDLDPCPKCGFESNPMAHITSIMLCDCDELRVLGDPEPGQGVVMDEAILDVISGLRVQVEGQWYSVKLTATKCDTPSEEDLS